MLYGRHITVILPIVSGMTSNLSHWDSSCRKVTMVRASMHLGESENRRVSNLPQGARCKLHFQVSAHGQNGSLTGPDSLFNGRNLSCPVSNDDDHAAFDLRPCCRLQRGYQRRSEGMYSCHLSGWRRSCRVQVFCRSVADVSTARTPLQIQPPQAATHDAYPVPREP